MQSNVTGFIVFLIICLISNIITAVESQNLAANNQATNQVPNQANPTENKPTNNQQLNNQQPKQASNAVQSPNLPAGNTVSSTGQVSQAQNKENDNIPVKGPVSDSPVQPKTVATNENNQQVKESPKETLNQNSNKIGTNAKVEDSQSGQRKENVEGATVHPCSSQDISKCFKLISEQMNKTEQLLNMANKTLALNDDNGENGENDKGNVTSVKGEGNKQQVPGTAPQANIQANVPAQTSDAKMPNNNVQSNPGPQQSVLSPALGNQNGQQSNSVIKLTPQNTQNNGGNAVQNTNPNGIQQPAPLTDTNAMALNSNQQVPAATNQGQIEATRRKRQAESEIDEDEDVDINSGAPLIMFSHKNNFRVKRQFLNGQQEQVNTGGLIQTGNIAQKDPNSGGGQGVAVNNGNNPVPNANPNSGGGQGVAVNNGNNPVPNANSPNNGANNQNNIIPGSEQNASNGQQNVQGPNSGTGNNGQPSVQGQNSGAVNVASNGNDNKSIQPLGNNNNNKNGVNNTNKQPSGTGSIDNASTNVNKNTGLLSNTNTIAANKTQSVANQSNNKGPGNNVGGTAPSVNSNTSSPLLKAVTNAPANSILNKSSALNSKSTEGSGMTPEDNEEAELENAPIGLILVVKTAGQSNLKVGEEVDGNLNPINSGTSSVIKNNTTVKGSNGNLNKNGSLPSITTNNNQVTSNTNANKNANNLPQGNTSADNKNLNNNTQNNIVPNGNNKWANTQSNGQKGQLQQNSGGIGNPGQPAEAVPQNNLGNNQLQGSNSNANNIQPPVSNNQNLNKQNNNANQGENFPAAAKNPSVVVNSVPQVQQVKQEPVLQIQEPEASPVMEEPTAETDEDLDEAPESPGEILENMEPQQV